MGCPSMSLARAAPFCETPKQSDRRLAQTPYNLLDRKISVKPSIAI
jgi:hypothetical protein